MPPKTFQSIDAGNQSWQAATGKTYRDYLGEDQISALRRAFQQRQLFAHTQGIVDHEYIMRSNDTSWQVGQRLVLRVDEVRQLVRLLRNLGEGMAREVSITALPPSLGRSTPDSER